MSKVSERISLGLAIMWAFITVVTVIGRVDTPWWNAAILMALLGFYNIKEYFEDKSRRKLLEGIHLPSRNSRY